MTTTRLARLRDKLRRASAQWVLPAALVGVLGLVVLLVASPTLLTEVQSVLNVIVPLLPVGLLAAVARPLWKKVMSEPEGSLTEAITNVLVRESLIRRLLWTGMVFEAIALSYILPLYSITVVVSPEEDTTSVDVSVEVRTGKDAVNVDEVGQREDGSRRFRSTGGIVPRASVRIVVSAGGFETDTVIQRMTGLFPPWYLFGGYSTPQIKLSRKRVTLTLQVTPEHAGVTGMDQSQDSLFSRAGPHEIRWNATVTVDVKAPGYDSVTRSIRMTNDTTVTIDLIRSRVPPGSVVVRSVKNPGGESLSGFAIYVDGDRNNAQLGEPFTLASGAHTLWLCMEVQEGFQVVEQRVQVDPDSIHTIDLVVEIVPGQSCEALNRER